jgi:hypothetical protein
LIGGGGHDENSDGTSGYESMNVTSMRKRRTRMTTRSANLKCVN